MASAYLQRLGFDVRYVDDDFAAVAARQKARRASRPVATLLPAVAPAGAPLTR